MSAAEVPWRQVGAQASQDFCDRTTRGSTQIYHLGMSAVRCSAVVHSQPETSQSFFALAPQHQVELKPKISRPSNVICKLIVSLP